MMNSEDIKKILQLSDEELNDKISAVMRATGKEMTGGIPKESLEKIKSTVSKMSEKDINSILSNVPVEKLAEIRNIVKNDT